MPRRPKHPRLQVYSNGHLVGLLLKDPSGAIAFQYDPAWVAHPDAGSVSLSLPLREDPFNGAPVQAVFENLLPDSEALRRRVAEKIGAEGTDAYSLLSRIGRDCVGTLQFLPEGEDLPATRKMSGEVLAESDVEALVKNLGQVPLGLDQQNDFRISVAGVQEKTALLYHHGKWMKPHGATPTSHILKTQIGKLPNGLDLSNSVENEFYCLSLLAAFGLPAAEVEMRVFGRTKVLVVKRFDRKWNSTLLRIPQEDCCQALAVPPAVKYQNQGGPGMVEILDLLKGSDQPREDQLTFLKAQIVFWLIGATDGHAKNFSVFLGPRGRYRLTPLYDVLTAQPSAHRREIERKQLKLAMFVGDNRHYRVDEIAGRHFVQTVKRARLPESLATDALSHVAETSRTALQTVEHALPRDFPVRIHEAVTRAMKDRLSRL